MSSDFIHLANGTRIADRYVIHSVLGKGGMGTVYLAKDEKLNHKKRVLKVPIDRYSEKVLIREADVLTQLNHSMLPELIDVIQYEQGYPTMIVMDYIDGETLDVWFSTRSSIVKPSLVLQWAIQLCDGFEYLHENFTEPIVYRDLKPSNIMIQKNGTLRLIDFGIARYSRQNQYKDTLPFATIGFASPEQLAGQRTDVRSDLYTLGSLMYYLLSGGKHYTPSQGKLDQWRNDLSGSLLDLIHKLLATSPHDRFQTTSETKQALYTINDRDQITYINRESQNPSRIILIGNVSRGSGATMAALALSSELQKHKMEHALVEYPENQPSMRFLLHNEKIESAFKSYGVRYDFLDIHAHQVDNASREMKQWQSSYSHSLCIIDISNHWEAEGVQLLAARAAEIWMIADPYPPRFNSIAAQKNMEIAMRWREMGRAVYFVANRYRKNPYLLDWIDAFPWKPDVMIPEWKPEQLYRFYAEGCMKAFPSISEKSGVLGWMEWMKSSRKGLSFSHKNGIL